MRVVADENIPLLEELFGDFAELHPLPAAGICADALKHADVLMVRSVTPVNRALLADSPVRLVATATIGTDHIDLDAMRTLGIPVESAPGCNARSVVEYVLSCMSLFSEERGIRLADLSVGIVGCGAIGGLLLDVLKQLGLTVRVYDPPRTAAGDLDSCDWQTVLACDVVTLHVPLTRTGQWPTEKLIDQDSLSQLGPQQLLINTSRGPVVDQKALKAYFDQGGKARIALDVWCHEPDIDAALASQCWIATPHIAGYSLDGRTGGSEAIYRRICRRFGLPARKKAAQYLPAAPLNKLGFTDSADPEWAMHTAIRACIDVRHDHTNLLRVLASEQPARGFESLRKHYRNRRSFSQVKVKVKGKAAQLNQIFRALGFQVVKKSF